MKLVEEYVPYYRPYYVVNCIGADDSRYWEIRERNSLFSHTDAEYEPGKFIARVDTCAEEAYAMVKLMNDQFNMDIRS